jgi:hypothetical protein
LIPIRILLFSKDVKLGCTQPDLQYPEPPPKVSDNKQQLRKLLELDAIEIYANGFRCGLGRDSLYCLADPGLSRILHEFRLHHYGEAGSYNSVSRASISRFISPGLV